MDVIGDKSMQQEKKYKCPIEDCNAAYNKPFKLEIHKRKHSGERPFICDFPDCSKSYTNIAHLKRHKYTVHERMFELICPEKNCGMVFCTKYNLKKHYTRSHVNSFNCTECSKSFKKKSLLNRHICPDKMETTFKCTSCNVCFDRIGNYNKHKINHKTYICDCEQTFERWSMFCEHRKRECTAEKKDHKCIICDKVFNAASNLKRHALTHIEESQRDIFRCHYLNCTRSYMFKKNLISHIRVFHENLQKTSEFSCSYPNCPVVLKSKKNLRQHLQNIHSGPKIIKPRRPRKDKGKPKKSMAPILSGVSITTKDHESFLSSGSNKTIPILSDNFVLSNKNASTKLEVILNTPFISPNKSDYIESVIEHQESPEKDLTNISKVIDLTDSGGDECLNKDSLTISC